MSIPPAILIVDDDETMRDACRQVLSRSPFRLAEDISGSAAMERLAREHFDLVLLDLRMPGRGGMEVLEWMRQHCPDTAAVVLTGFATVNLAVEAMRKGAADFLAKPFTPDQLREAVARAIQGLGPATPRHDAGPPPASERHELVGDSAPLRQIRELVEKVAPTDSTVLITGESGTGKEVVARTLRDLSRRRDRPFVVVDCGALVGTLFESELFGHVRGSFTGATTTKHGRLELADGGTIFLDEIANVGPEIQAKLLRLIQEKEYNRVGSTQVVPVDVRIIAATSRNLPEEIRAGRFREDLYYRLCVVPIVLPPLRQRVEDIPRLAEYFLRRFDRRRDRHLGFSPDALELLVHHAWPGNVRELQNTVERAVILAHSDQIQPKDLLWLAAAAQVEAAPSTRLEDLERDHIERVLQECGGNRSAAARALGIDRKTLWRKLR